MKHGYEKDLRIYANAFLFTTNPNAWPAAIFLRFVAYRLSVGCYTLIQNMRNIIKVKMNNHAGGYLNAKTQRFFSAPCVSAFKCI
jgi:hypothetical protein